MQNHFMRIAAGFALVCLANAASAQAPPAAAAPAGAAAPMPTYISIPLEVTVNRPAAEVWKRVGKFCDIGEWLRIACTITAGKDGEFGAVRSVASEAYRSLNSPPSESPAPHELSRRISLLKNKIDRLDADDPDNPAHAVFPVIRPFCGKSRPALGCRIRNRA